MIDKSRPKTKRGTLPAFAPVPRLTKRHDGWTPERQRGFIEALGDCGSVKSAAHAVNMTPEGAYNLRRHAQAGEFRKAWEAALALGIQRLEDVAMDRALNGVEVPVYSYGKIIGTRRIYNDALLMFLLRNRAPKRFAADSINNTDAATQGQLDRLKAHWRKEWDAEKAKQDAYDAEEVIRSLDAKLELMHQRHQAKQARELEWQGDQEDDEYKEEDPYRIAANSSPPPPPKRTPSLRGTDED